MHHLFRSAPSATVWLALLLPLFASADVQRFELINVTHSYADSATISDDGRFVTYQYGHEVYVRDRVYARTVRASLSNVGVVEDTWSVGAGISGNGRYVLFSSDFNLATGQGGLPGSFWVRDLVAGRTELVSVSSTGEPAYSTDAAISRDGRYVMFVTEDALVANDANGTRDVYLRDRALGTTEVVSFDTTGQPAGYSEGRMSISDDGRYVAFTSYAHTLVGQPIEDGAIYVYDRQLKKTELISVPWAGVSTRAYGGVISGNGRYVAFISHSWNMVRGDTNNTYDVFVRDRVAGATTRVSVTSTGQQLNGGSWSPSISTDGRFVAFASRAPNLVPAAEAGSDGLFVHDRSTGRTEFISASNPRNAPVTSVVMTRDGRTVAFDTDKALVSTDRDQVVDVYAADLTVPGTIYQFTVKPTSADFGDTPLGATRTLKFWLRNKGTSPLPLLRVFTRSGDAEMFIASHACGTVVPVDGGCSIAVTFTPTRAGVASTNLVVVAGSRQVRERPLVGNGVQP